MSQFYHIPIVHAGIKHIVIIRDGIVIFDGTVPAGFKYHLTYGDEIWDYTNYQKLLFKIVMWGNKPAIRFKNVPAGEHNQYLIDGLVIEQRKPIHRYKGSRKWRTYRKGYMMMYRRGENQRRYLQKVASGEIK